MLIASVGGLYVANRAVTRISVRSSAMAESHYHGVEIPRMTDDQEGDEA